MVWAGLIIKESDETHLLNKIFELKEKHQLNPYDPIKFNPPKESAQRQKIQQQNIFREEVLSLLSSAKVTLIAAYYDGTKNLGFTDMAFQLINDLSIRFEFFISSKNTTNKHHGSIILSYPGTREALPFSNAYYEIQKNKAVLYSKNWHSSDHVPIQLKHLEPSIYFSFEIHNPLIQMADYVAGSVASALKNKSDEFFSIIKPRFRSINQNIKGIGLISYPHYTKEIDRPKKS